MYLMAIVVFFARLIDVSLGTLKLKAVMRGSKVHAFIIAFIEVIVYALAASKAFQYIDRPEILVMYALGYASGNYIGILLDERVSKGIMMVTVITNYDQWSLANKLREQGYGVTTSKGYGLNGTEKAQLTVIVEKNNIKELIASVNEHDSQAYIIHMDVRGIISNSNMK